MRATPRFRLFNNRGAADDNVEAQQQRREGSARRRVTSRQSSYYRRNDGRLNHRRRRPASSILFRCSRGPVTVTLAVAVWSFALVTYRLLHWLSTHHFSSDQPPSGGPIPALGDNLGPDAIPSVFVVERSENFGPRQYPPLGGGQNACLNTAQGKALLADSEGRVCYRNAERNLVRPGCCSTKPPRPLSPRDGPRSVVPFENTNAQSSENDRQQLLSLRKAKKDGRRTLDVINPHLDSPQIVQPQEA
ncbi:unnamed protein product, partial [Sphacelaria rigidula]